MKFLSLIVSVISVLTASCSDELYPVSPPSLPEDDYSLPYSPEPGDLVDELVTNYDSEDQASLLEDVQLDGTDQPQNIVSPDANEQLNEEESRRNVVDPRNSRQMVDPRQVVDPRSSAACTTKGGVCMSKKKKKNCKGQINTDYTCSYNGVCCMPDPMLQSIKDDLTIIMSNLTSMGCPEGFFSAPSSSKQCFKFYDTWANWTAANATCHAEGLVMARPYDAVALRSYLVQRYGYWSIVWLNARGTGSYVRWQDNNDIILSSNPLWYSGYPGSYTSTSYCLTLCAYPSYWKSYPQQPYMISSCSSSRRTLCELVSE